MLHPPVLDLSLPLFVPPVPFDTVVEIRYSSLASLIFLIWDICVTFDQEVEFIWKQHARFPVKWLFLFVRYWAVVIQTLIFLTATGGITNIGLRADQCETWYSFQSFATQSLTIAVEMILMLRVYALYNRSRAMRILMLAILAIEVAFVVPVYVIYVPRVKYGIQCSATTTQDSKALFVSISTASILIQFILSGFTLVKTAGAIKSGWGRTPVMIILMRDGSWVFLIQFGAMMLNAIHTVQVGPIKGHIVFTWFWAILSFSTCRLVLNLYAAGKEMSARNRRRRRRSRIAGQGNSDDLNVSSGQSSDNPLTTNIDIGLGFDEDGTFEMTDSTSWDREHARRPSR